MNWPITSFTGEYSFLSNFYPQPNGGTVEHGFQASKTLDGTEQASIFEANTPGEAKKLGRKVTLRPDWEDIKIQVMAELVAAKFRNSDLAWQLHQTGFRLLVEGNTWHDNDWGSCTCGRAGCVKMGHNWLGVILMAVRSVDIGG